MSAFGIQSPELQVSKVRPVHTNSDARLDELEKGPHGACPPRVLIADDQTGVHSALRLLLKTEGFESATASSPAAVVGALRETNFDLVLLDLNYSRDTTSGREGIELLEEIRRSPVAPPVVVMTAWGSVELAVEAMRKGARDFVLKPWDNRRLMEIIREQVKSETPARFSEEALASQVQRRLMPQRAPRLATLELAALCHPAGAVSGDYWTVLEEVLVWRMRREGSEYFHRIGLAFLE